MGRYGCSGSCHHVASIFDRFVFSTIFNQRDDPWSSEMNESVKNPSESIGELFLMAYGGLDPEPALSMIRDYGISGFYLSNDNVPDRKTAQDLSRILQE